MVSADLSRFLILLYLSFIPYYLIRAPMLELTLPRLLFLLPLSASSPMLICPGSDSYCYLTVFKTTFLSLNWFLLAVIVADVFGVCSVFSSPISETFAVVALDIIF